MRITGRKIISNENVSRNGGTKCTTGIRASSVVNSRTNQSEKSMKVKSYEMHVAK